MVSSNLSCEIRIGQLILWNKVITFLMTLGDGVGLHYTDYVIPSGTGTRIVSYCASPSFVDTGEDLRDGDLLETIRPLAEGYGDEVELLAQLAGESAAELTTT